VLGAVHPSTTQIKRVVTFLDVVDSTQPPPLAIDWKGIETAYFCCVENDDLTYQLANSISGSSTHKNS